MCSSWRWAGLAGEAGDGVSGLLRLGDGVRPVLAESGWRGVMLNCSVAVLGRTALRDREPICGFGLGCFALHPG